MQWIVLFLSRKSTEIFEFKIAILLLKNATAILLSDRNKILNDEQRRQRNSLQIKIDNAEKSLFPKKMKCIMINNYYKGLRIL